MGKVTIAIVLNFFKNIVGWTIMTVANRAIYEIFIYCGRTDVPTLWASNNPIEIVGTIIFGALIFSMQDWWSERKRKNEIGD